jgi:hypothetical protein
MAKATLSPSLVQWDRNTNRTQEKRCDGAATNDAGVDCKIPAFDGGEIVAGRGLYGWLGRKETREPFM